MCRHIPHKYIIMIILYLQCTSKKMSLAIIITITTTKVIIILSQPFSGSIGSGTGSTSCIATTTNNMKRIFITNTIHKMLMKTSWSAKTPCYT